MDKIVALCGNVTQNDSNGPGLGIHSYPVIVQAAALWRLTSGTQDDRPGTGPVDVLVSPLASGISVLGPGDTEAGREGQDNAAASRNG